jgi:formiminoglutamase
MELKSLNADYQSGQQIYWTGRKSNPDLGKQYWYQEIELIDLHQIKNENTIDIALLGYVCDEGVLRNLGRIGAA